MGREMETKKHILKKGAALAFLDIGHDGTIGSDLATCQKALNFESELSLNLFDWICQEDKGKFSSALIEASGSGTYGPAPFILKIGDQVRRLLLLIFKSKGKQKEFRVYFLPDDQPECPFPLSQNKLLTLGTLTSGIVHDLNNMFTGIWTFSALIKHNSDDPKVLAYVDSIEASLKQASDLTANVTRFLREEPSENVENPSAYLAEIAKVFKFSIGGRVRLVLDLSKEEAPLNLSPSELGQIFLNLICNAADALKSKGTIFVKTEIFHDKKCTFFVLEIEDDGPGIAHGVQKKIFEPFYTTKSGKGTGLGLSIVKHLVEKGGGAIELFSQKGEGTRFVIFLPVIKG